MSKWVVKINFLLCRWISIVFKKMGFIYIMYDPNSGECTYVSNLIERDTIKSIIQDLGKVMEEEGVIRVQ